MRSRYRTAAWIAALAMALHALWPLLVHAKPQQAAHLVALCTVDGTTHYVELPAGKPPAGEHSPTQHCKLSTFGAERAFAPPPAAFVASRAIIILPAVGQQRLERCGHGDSPGHGRGPGGDPPQCGSVP